LAFLAGVFNILNKPFFDRFKNLIKFEKLSKKTGNLGTKAAWCFRFFIKVEKS
jgi:hypothetical protein